MDIRAFPAGHATFEGLWSKCQAEACPHLLVAVPLRTSSRFALPSLGAGLFGSIAATFRHGSVRRAKAARRLGVSREMSLGVDEIEDGSESNLDRNSRSSRTRNADLIDPPAPPDVSPYMPGEGYGSNAIPFAGVAPKTSRRRNESNRMEVVKMIKNAKVTSESKRKEIMRRKTRIPSQLLPVPEERVVELQQKGWLDALEADGVTVEVLSETDEAHGTNWVHLQLSGETRDLVQAGVLRLMAMLTPACPT